MLRQGKKYEFKMTKQSLISILRHYNETDTFNFKPKIGLTIFPQIREYAF